MNSTQTTHAATRYSAPAMVLHWVLAVALIGMFIVGVYMTSLPFSPSRLKLYNWHKWAGICVLTLSLLRLLWRLSHRPPELPPGPAWQLRLAAATHVAMYICFFAVPLLGWAYSSAAGFPVVVFGVLPLPDFVSPSRELAEVLKPWHGRAAFALAGLVLLHVAAALKHQWVDRDGLLSRMGVGRAPATQGVDAAGSAGA